MKLFKSNLSQSKQTCIMNSNPKKAALGTTLGKENTNTLNSQIRQLPKKSSKKEVSPKNSSNRTIQAVLCHGTIYGKPSLRQEKVHQQKTNRSQEKLSAQEQKERSCTPGSIKDFMAKIRKQSFHLSPKENFKVNFKGRALRMGSPTSHQSRNLFENITCEKRPTVNSSSPKSRQINSYFFTSENLKITGTEGTLPTKDTLKGSLLSQTTNLNHQSSQESFLVVGNCCFNSACINHPNKKSTFFLTESPAPVSLESQMGYYKGFCSKCAVRLASAGHNIEEIYPEEDEMKNKKLSSLIQRISTVVSLIKITKEHVSKREDKTLSHYKAQLESIMEVQLQVEKIFSAFFKAAESVKKQLTEEFQSHSTQCEEFMGQLTSKELELQSYAKRFSDYQTNNDLMSELSNLDTYIGNFNSALGITVEDCKALHEMKLMGSKLSPSFLVVGPLVHSKLQDLLKFRISDILFQHTNIEKYTQLLAYWGELNKSLKNNFIAESSVDTTSWNEYRNEKHKLLSFDKKATAESRQSVHDVVESSFDKESPSKNFDTILERIDENQDEKLKYYNAILAEEQQHQIEVDDGARMFSEHHTPELGVKEILPDFLKTQFARLQLAQEAPSLQKTNDQKQNLKPESSQPHPQHRALKPEFIYQTNYEDGKGHSKKLKEFSVI